MKRNSSTGVDLIHKTTAAKALNSKAEYSGRRKEMAGFLRFLIILLLVLLLAATTLAAYARFEPVIFKLPSRAYSFEKSSSNMYQVQNLPNTLMDQTIQGMDMVYLSDYAAAVLPVFSYQVNGDRSVLFDGYYQLACIVRLRSLTDPNQILFEKTEFPADPVTISMQSRKLVIEQSDSVDLEFFRKLMTEIEAESDLDGTYELEIGLQLDLDIISNDNLVHEIIERPSMVMPLGTDTFTITNQPVQSQKETVWLWNSWQLFLSPLPIWLYPTVFGLCLVLLIVFIAGTKSRRKNRFHRQLRKMMRKARGRLMLIGDKAWEPEWCVTASNFKSMVKTARKLKHPIFCYVENNSDVPAAFFYVYYGENNYCYTFTGKKDRKWHRQNDHTGKAGSKESDIISDSIEALGQLPPELLETKQASANQQPENRPDYNPRSITQPTNSQRGENLSDESDQV